MLRTEVDPEPTLREAMLPGEFRRLPPWAFSAIDREVCDDESVGRH